MKAKSKQKIHKNKYKVKPKQTTLPITPIKIIKQAKQLKTKIASCYSKNSYVISLVQLAELNSLISNISLQFIPYLLEKSDLNLFINIFTKINEHKEIVVCLIMKIFEAYFYIQVGKQNSIQQKDKNISEQLIKFFDLIDFCLTLNSKQSNHLIYQTLVYALYKLQSWCTLINKYQKIGEQINIYLQQNYKEELQLTKQ